MSLIQSDDHYYTLSPETPLAKEIIKAYRWYSPKFSPRDVPYFADVGSVTENPAVMRRIRDFLVARYRRFPEPVTHVLGFDARGFLFGPMVALELGVPFVLVRKAGKNAGVLIESEPYEKEYREDRAEAMTIRRGSVGRGARVVAVDDVLATGGTALSGLQLVEASGAKTVELVTLMNITPLEAPKKIHAYKNGCYKDVNIVSLVELSSLSEDNCGDSINYNGPRLISYKSALSML